MILFYYSHCPLQKRNSPCSRRGSLACRFRICFLCNCDLLVRLEAAVSMDRSAEACSVFMLMQQYTITVKGGGRIRNTTGIYVGKKSVATESPIFLVRAENFNHDTQTVSLHDSTRTCFHRSIASIFHLSIDDGLGCSIVLQYILFHFG
jgi:hypothetical protein